MLRDNRKIEGPILACLREGPRTARAISDDSGIDLESVKAVLSRLALRDRISRVAAPQHRHSKRGRTPFLYSIPAG